MNFYDVLFRKGIQSSEGSSSSSSSEWQDVSQYVSITTENATINKIIAIKNKQNLVFIRIEGIGNIDNTLIDILEPINPSGMCSFVLGVPVNSLSMDAGSNIMEIISSTSSQWSLDQTTIKTTFEDINQWYLETSYYYL